MQAKTPSRPRSLPSDVATTGTKAEPLAMRSPVTATRSTSRRLTAATQPIDARAVGERTAVQVGDLRHAVAVERRREAGDLDLVLAQARAADERHQGPDERRAEAGRPGGVQRRMKHGRDDERQRREGREQQPQRPPDEERPEDQVEPQAPGRPPGGLAAEHRGDEPEADHPGEGQHCPGVTAKVAERGAERRLHAEGDQKDHDDEPAAAPGSDPPLGRARFGQGLSV